MTLKKQSLWSLLEWFLPWVVLFFLIYFTVGLFSFLPYAGAQISTNVITRVFSQADGSNNFQPEDVLLRVGSVTAEQVARDLRIGFFDGLQANQTIDVTVERKGQPLSFPYTIPPATPEELRSRLESQWVISYIFWLAGTVSLLFLRPRSLQRLLLALFCFVTAIWLNASILSGRHYADGALLIRSTVWLSVPIYLHLHWLFPTALRRLQNWVWAALYAVCGLLAVLSWLQVVPQSFYLFGFILMIAGSLAMLGAHLIRQPAERRPLAGLVVALGFVLLPALGYGILGLLHFSGPFGGMTVLGLAALPGFYFYTLFRRQLNPIQAQLTSRMLRLYAAFILTGLLFCIFLALIAQTPIIYQNIKLLDTLAFVILVVISLVNFLPFLVLPALANENITLAVGGARLSFSANRTAAGVFFLLLDTLVALLLSLGVRILNLPGADGVSLMVAALGAGALALLGYPAFRRFFEDKVLGMRLAPESLLAAYAGRITTSLDQQALGRLLLDEVLPSLLVREFAQVELRGDALETTFSLRVDPAAQPVLAQAALERAALRSAATSADGLPGWVRLVLPLRAAGKTSGYWLLGRRDPDDRYAPEDIANMQALADQTALALINIAQAEALRALYFADIERNESERLLMAAELHDDVLNQLAVLSMNLQDAAPLTLHAYDQAVFHIRQIINGLRPAMLQYGLFAALETLADELNDRLAAQNGPSIVLEVPRDEVRYEQRIELALFRIAQQACANAVRHAQCQTIRISGELCPDQVKLFVGDDGKGFPAGSRIDLPALLAGKHFGLAGMFERAASIGAQLQVTSQPGQGCQVELGWQKK